jgi:uncharacterized Fe-S cluster-containing radical SAM superfamily protein
VAATDYPLFILETNGILLGSDRDYVKRLAPFADKLYVRVSLKAATPEGFTQRTGGLGEFLELPFRALTFLLEDRIFCRAAAMTDHRVMPREERSILLARLRKIDSKLATDLEEEAIGSYETTTLRLQAFHDKEFFSDLEEMILGGTGDP